MTRVLFVAAEAHPFVRVGGMADFVGSLPRALQALGDEVSILIPHYPQQVVGLVDAREVACDLSVLRRPARILGLAGHPRCLFLDCPELFDWPAIYDSERLPPARWAALSRAALELARQVLGPQVIHCHDYHSALVPTYKRTVYADDRALASARTVFTIHNLTYQGLFSPAIVRAVDFDESLLAIEALEFYGDVNLMRGGIVFSDAVTTVSESYARQIQTPEFGGGLDGVLRQRSEDLHGILNGIDYELWNPETDPHIASTYSAANLTGKRKCKAALLRGMGLDEDLLDGPLCGVVSRLTHQKGIDALGAAIPKIIEGGAGVAVLGTGDPAHVDVLRGAQGRWPRRVALVDRYEEPLAHKVYAGADLFLIPSRFEPCGASQLVCQRYGAVPIATATGGLADTVDEESGFRMASATAECLAEAVDRAISAFQVKERWEERVRNCMRKDFSWVACARRYSALYHDLCSRKGA